MRLAVRGYPFLQQGRASSSSSSAPPATAAAASPPPSGRPLSEAPGPRRWPVVGTLPDLFLSGGPKKIPQVYQGYYQKYGPVVLQYLFSEPEVLLFDPRDAPAVFHGEGKYPVGPSVEFAWPLAKYYELRGEVVDLLAMDHRWQDARRKFQQDLFSPQAADGYLPHINDVLRDASAAAAGFAGNFPDFSARLSFDMFARLCIGASTRSVRRQRPEDEEFIDAAIQSISLFSDLAFRPWEQQKPGKVFRRFEAEYSKVERRTAELMRQTREAFSSPSSPSPSSSSGEPADPLLGSCFYAKIII